MTTAETRACQNCKASFAIDASDFPFYKKMGVPAPILCPECRFRRRAVFRNEHCPNEFETSYAPERPEIVYCEPCYNAEVA